MRHEDIRYIFSPPDGGMKISDYIPMRHMAAYPSIAGEPFLEKSPNIRKCTLFPKWACPKNPEMSISGKKAAGGPAAETARSFSEHTSTK